MTDVSFLREKIKQTFRIDTIMLIALIPFFIMGLFTSFFIFLDFFTPTIAGIIYYAINWKKLFSPKLGELSDTELIENMNIYIEKTKPLIAVLILGLVVSLSYIILIILFYSLLNDPISSYIFFLLSFLVFFSMYALLLRIMLKTILKEFDSIV